MKDNVVSFNEAVQKRTEVFKKSAAYSAQTVGNAIKNIHENTEDIKTDVKEGLHVVADEVRITTKHVISELDNL
jgi:hypothetical protein